jgi:hypothetical protein
MFRGGNNFGRKEHLLWESDGLCRSVAKLSRRIGCAVGSARNPDSHADRKERYSQERAATSFSR